MTFPIGARAASLVVLTALAPFVGASGPRVDVYGDPLPDGAIARLGTTRLRHRNSITFVAFTPDGKELVSCGLDGVRVWDARTGKELRRHMAREDEGIECAALSPDGKTVFTLERKGQEEFAIHLRDRATLRSLLTIPVVGQLRSFRLSPDGRYLAGLDSFARPFQLWEVASGRRQWWWNDRETKISCYDFSADGQTLVSAGGDGVIRLWRHSLGRSTGEIPSRPADVTQMALSPDGKWLAALGGTARPGESVISILDVASGKEIRRLRIPKSKNYDGFEPEFVGMALGPDGRTLVTAGNDQLMRFWDVATGKELRRWSHNWVTSPCLLAFSPDMKTLAVYGDETFLLVLDAATGRDPTGLNNACEVTAVAFTPDGRTAITASAQTSTLMSTASPRSCSGAM